ncbi:MAG: hypothetical protein V4598_04245 [Bdellovibrionota bacterium]
MKSIALVSLIFLVACSSAKRTQYGPHEKKNGGYTDGILEDSIHITRFEANSLTKRSYAEMFARYHSLEKCRQEGKAYAHILAVIDQSDKKKITRTNGDSWGPSYYYGMGMSPFYSRYSGFGFSTGVNVINTRAWEETLIFPNIETIYHCAEKVYEPEIAMRDVPPEEMKLLVKDLKGAIQVEKILPGSPNTNLKEEDIILRAEGKRIMKGHQLLALFKDNPKLVRVEILRDGERKQIDLRGQDVTVKVKENLVTLKNQACDFKDVKTKSSLCREKW